MIIRKATLKDLEKIKQIEDESFAIPFKEKDLIYEICDNPVSNFLLLENEDKIIGFIDYWVTFDSATIDQICIKKDERNKGFASFLLKNAIEKVKENREVEFFTLEVRKSNLPAIKLYEKFGFTKVTIKAKYYDDGEDAIYMIKGLV